MMNEKYMREAIRTMRKAGVLEKTGGPFGAVIVRENTILAVAGNSVIKDRDPTAHAEINALRQLAPEQILCEEAQSVWKEFRAMSNGARY